MVNISAFTKKDYEILAEFRYALRHFLVFSKEAAERTGLTMQQHQALLAIIGYPGRERVTIGELAERLQVRHHSAVGLVNRLESLGLVERRQNPADKRQVIIGLSHKGRDVLESLANIHREELRQLGPQLCVMLEEISHFNDGK